MDFVIFAFQINPINMNFKPLSILLIAILFILMGCQKENTGISEGPGDLLGTWTNPQYTDSTITYTKSDNVPFDDYSITFKNQQTLTERKNAGWCGTPPITYGDFDGSWIRDNAILNIEVPFWGGTSKYEWKIKSISSNQLVVVILAVEYE